MLRLLLPLRLGEFLKRLATSFGTEEEYRRRITEKELFDEFTQDENGNVVMSEEEGQKKIESLGGYDKLYRIKFEADYLAKLAYEGAKPLYGDPIPIPFISIPKEEIWWWGCRVEWHSV